jgi:adenylate kinase family enzyme
MKINIIGPSASGKTTLARKLSNGFNLKHINLDYVLFRHVGKKNRIAVKKDKYLAEIKGIVKGDNWLIEGINPFNIVLKNAEVIIWLKPSLLSALKRQWKRYFTDSRQRREHGFINNVKLSRYIIRQYLGNPNKKTDPKGTWVKSVNRVLERYQDKVMVVNSNSELSSVVEKVKLLEKK